MTILAAQQDSAPEPPQPPRPPRDSHGLRYVIAGVVLLLVSIAGVYAAYLRYAVNSGPVMIAPSVSAPIFVDEREQVSGTGPVLMQAIERSGARTLAPGAIRLLYLQDATTTGDNVFLSLGLRAPGILLRNVNASGGMAGIINAGGTQDPFFILSVASYRDTFAGMLSWEPTMPDTMALLFPPYPLTSASSTTTATSTSSSTSTQQYSATPPGFRDETVANHDVRVYRSVEGRSIILYGYWDQRTLVIARNTAAFTEILQRLATSRAQ